MKLFRWITAIQAIYILLTAVWPLIDIKSFMDVTGYKTDIWLVKTVGALLIPISACLISYLFIDTDRRPAFVLGLLLSVAFIIVDFYYALTDVISDVYLLDGVVQIIFFLCWLLYAMRHKVK